MTTPDTLQEKLWDIGFTDVQIAAAKILFAEAGWISPGEAQYFHDRMAQEFYDRFKAELDKKREEMDWIASSPTFNKTWHLESSILEAAKRAAGLAGVSDE